MTRKIIPLNSYMSASDAADLLSQKLGRPISPEYIRKLARRKKQPVQTQPMGNRLLYSREDILACSIKESKKKSTPQDA